MIYLMLEEIVKDVGEECLRGESLRMLEKVWGGWENLGMLTESLGRMVNNWMIGDFGK